MSRSKKYDEPTRAVTMHLPESAIARLDAMEGSRADAILSLLDPPDVVRASDLPTPKVSPPGTRPYVTSSPPDKRLNDKKLHADCRQRLISGRPYCLDHKRFLS